MTFLVSEIGLTTLLPHSVSILREKLCKVDIKCNTDMFFNFLALFLKINIFEVFDIFSRLQSIRKILRPMSLPPILMLCGDVTASGWTVFVIQVPCISDTTLSWGDGTLE